MTKVHFLGIGGPGASGTAVIAKHNGFEVSGCDTLCHEKKFFDALAGEGIRLYNCNDPSHVSGSTLVVASLALFHTPSPNPEFEEAARRGLLTSWQEFLGKRILERKFSIVICGAHGKTTTSGLMSHVMVAGGLDPTAMVGGILVSWRKNYRIGTSQYYLCEGDEKVFHHFPANAVIITNVEYEHPEHFRSSEDCFGAYVNFVSAIRTGGILVANADDPGSRRLLEVTGSELVKKQVKVIHYSLLRDDTQVRGYALSENSFSVENRSLSLKVFGRHNLQNALAVYAMSKALGIDADAIELGFNEFQGIERRLEKVYSDDTVVLYDDYAHHPTEIEASLRALRFKHDRHRLIAIFEPHQVTRIQVFWDRFLTALEIADEIIITAIYPGREEGKELPDLQEKLVKLGRPKFKYAATFDLVLSLIADREPDETVIVTMGAGDSSALAAAIRSQLQSDSS